MKNFFLVLVLLVPATILGQDAVEDRIQQIKSRFYSLTNNTLTKLQLEGFEFYFQNGNLKKVISRTNTNIYEYYFDLDYTSHHAYFIYTIDDKNGKKLENRYYFGKDDHPIRWLGPDKKEVDLESEGGCEQPLLLISKSTDFLIMYNNYLLSKKNPSYSSVVEEIDEKMKDFSNRSLLSDTIEVENAPEEYYYSHKVLFSSQSGKKIKLLSFSGGDHAATTTTSFFDSNEQVMFEIEENRDVFGHYRLTHGYFKDGDLFRRVAFSSVSGNWGRCRDFQYAFIPEFSDY
ncbi:MAG: hypothetical protein RIG68_00915 [Imperialibacter sp.]|uniref:hypothetical protein n=1 Tax=Imperialibacter sp. TaxID=2038411 RepID=UPI0032EC9DDD